MKKSGPPAPTTPWASLIEWFRWALDDLAPASSAPIEALAVDVFTSMAGALRRFHTSAHIFSFRPSDPLETLAVLYHDVVYWSVDGSWPPAFAKALDTAAPAGVVGTALARSSDIPHYADILAVFGLKPGDLLAKTGVNELFSALAFSSALGALLGREKSLAVCACIEATIPFRGPAARTVLRDRLVALGTSPQEAGQWLGRAVRLANQDVGDFKLDDVGAFLGGTWNLLPELNPELRITAVFTIQAYRKALDAMNRFFAFLTPDVLFDSWDDEPGEAQLTAWKARAAENLAVARRYMAAKLQAAALLEAFALATGPDVPLSLFMGSSTDSGDGRLETLLPALPGKPGKDPVFLLLEHGRATHSSFDLTNSPLAAWIYRQGTEAEREAQRGPTTEFFAGKLGAREYLAGYNRDLIAILARALAGFVPTRREALSALIPK